MDNWWTLVLWLGSTKLCSRFRKHFRWFALKYFFGLHIKNLIALKIFGATLGIGGGNCPHCPPLGTRLVTERALKTVEFADDEEETDAFTYEQELFNEVEIEKFVL